MNSRNGLADEVVGVALRGMQVSWEFKLPRIGAIRKYRRLYNTEVLPKLRQQFNVPLPIFAGMVDTLQADLNDNLLIEYGLTDPADWKAIEKANAAIKKEAQSARPGAQWGKKFRQYRFEKIITGRGIMHFSAGSDGGYHSELEVVPFEDFFFEPLGGGNLENHLFCGRQNVWKSRSDLLRGVKDGIYDAAQVRSLVGEKGDTKGRDYKMAPLWDGMHDFGGRFRPLGLNAENDNYVGEEVYNLCEFVVNFKGRRWYVLFEPYTGTWVRFDKNENLLSSDHFPFMSSASHEDLKNFASKSFADDLYPVADSVITLFNQDLTNRSKRNLNARAYDRSMFKDVGKLDEAQYRPDALVPADTQGGAKRISEGIYAFQTPEIKGTIDLIEWLQRDSGKSLGVSEMQQGAGTPASKKVGVAYAELAQVSKRLDFSSTPFREMGQQLGERFFASLKDYMKEPMSIQLLGEHGIEWDVLNRIDLDTKHSVEITVSSQMARNNSDEQKTAGEMKAFQLTAGSPHVNQRVRDEMIFRKVGKFDEHDIALLLDPGAETDKETLAEAAAAIQDIVIRGKRPATNHNADRYFVKRLLDFARKHYDSLSRKAYDTLIAYADEHIAIAEENLDREVERDMQRAAQVPGAEEEEVPGSPVERPMPKEMIPAARMLDKTPVV